MPRTPLAGALIAMLFVITAACGAGATPAASDPATTSPAPDTDIGPAAPTTMQPPAPIERTGEATTSTSAPAASSDCRRLTDFDDDRAGGWVVVDDGVMGGRSSGIVEFSGSEMRFTGELITRGGGFTSIRLPLDGQELANTDRIVMRVRADDRDDGLTLEDDGRSSRRAISHRADLAFDQPTDDWTTVSLPHGALEPTVFGQPVDADPFDPDRATEFGIIIADGADGTFALSVDWIDACG
ncbi:CIA30 family protein [Ilumatobacter sp.]|uniref:CIA30 family protein n=1 Tax=Ilumatobacter sp. TaxID=1967498 RepID=UPI003AF81493